MQKWVTIDEEYLSILRQVDNRVPFSDYGKDKYKPFFGTLFEKDDLVYVVAISHAQEKLAMQALQSRRFFSRAFGTAFCSRLQPLQVIK